MTNTKQKATSIARLTEAPRVRRKRAVAGKRQPKIEPTGLRPTEARADERLIRRVQSYLDIGRL